MRILRPGYSYTVRKSKTDLQAVIQISSRLFRRFVERCGAVNTIAKPGLTVAYQGGGHYLVFTVDDSKSRMVTEFLARLNRWAIRESGADRPFADSLFLSSAQRGSPYREHIVGPETQPERGTRTARSPQGPMAFAWTRMMTAHFGTPTNERSTNNRTPMTKEKNSTRHQSTGLPETIKNIGRTIRV
jgi:hypothetical protein